MQDESVDYGLDITSHPVEKGINISDHARRQPYTLKLRGEIVGEDAPEKRSQVEQLMNKAALITYQGRNIKTSGLIESFSTGHPNTIYGGCSFDMTIKEIRVASGSGYIGNITPTTMKTTPLKEPQETGTQKIEQNSTEDETYTARTGDSMYEQGANGDSNKYKTIYENSKGIDVTKIVDGDRFVITEKTKTRTTYVNKDFTPNTENPYDNNIISSVGNFFKEVGKEIKDLISGNPYKK